MPYLVNIDNHKTIFLPNENIKRKFIGGKLTIAYDTEFTFKDKLTVDSIQLFIPEIMNKHECLVYPYDELTIDFNPWIDPLNAMGLNVNVSDENYVDDLLTKVQSYWYEITENVQSNRDYKKILKQTINDDLWQPILSSFNLTSDNLECKKINDEYEILINLPKITINYLAFFADVDIFKTVGQNYQSILLDSSLESRRTIKTSEGTISHPVITLNDYLYEVEINLKDAMNRFPVLSGKGLDNQSRVYQTGIRKFDIVTQQNSDKLGLKNPNQIKENMSLFRLKCFNDFLIYGAQDSIATYLLSEKLQELLTKIRTDFNLELSEVKDTTGSNVSKFIYDLYHNHFNPSDNKNNKIEITKQIRLGHADKIQNIELNDFGIQTLRTVGGLLYTRMARFPYLNGLFGDLDMQSCYATRLSNLTIYLGQPIVTTFKAKKYKPTLKEVLQFVENNAPRDSWLIRVSGELKEAVNTLVLSDLDFNSKRVKFKTIWDIDPNRKSINLFNAYKTSSKEAESTLLTKEIKFGLINADIIDNIRLFLDSWIEEFLNLSVDCFLFIPNELVCYSLDELQSKKSFYPIEENLEKWDKSTGLKTIKDQYSQNNLCLAMPINEYFEKLKDKRSEYKDAKNPIQEVYKLFLNSGYGALACEHLAVNNLLAANQITASARATGWLMINALNGFQVITDGCTYSWENIPIGKTFKQILLDNPDYLLDFSPEIKNDFDVINANQSWINDNFINHLHNFYGVDNTHIPSNRYDYELKLESFQDSQGLKHETTFYSEFINSGSGNYCKGLNGSFILLDGSEYNFNDNHKKVKARSFKGNDDSLLNWYIDCLKNEYKEPVIYHENQIIKFGEANRLAIQLLNSGIDEIAHPVGFSKHIFKLMKLITRSQFLFKNEKQLRNFERTNQLGKLDNLSKFWLNKSFWDSLNFDDLTDYGITELNKNIDYFEFSKSHTIGLGFELLALNSTHKKSLKSVRNFIADSIQLGKTNFNACLNIDRSIALSKDFKYLFASLIVFKANSEYELKQILINSINEPTVMVVNKDTVKTLGELLEIPDN
jgi:hypothetical protein